MLINFFKLKNISCLRSQANRGKVLAVSIVGGVFVFLILLAIWHRNFSDTHIQYVPEDSIFYAHFSRPKIQDSQIIDDVIYKILADIGLSDYQSLNLSREVSISGQLIDGQMEYGVVISTDRPTRARQAIDTAGLTYKFLSPTRIVIASDEMLDYYIKNNKNSVSQNTNRRFTAFNSLSIYGSSEFFDFYSNELLLGVLYESSLDESGNVFLNLKVKKNGLHMFVKNTSRASRSLSYFIVAQPEETIDGDIVFITSNFSQLLSGWRNGLDKVSPDDNEIFSNTLVGQYLGANKSLTDSIKNLSLVASKNNNNSGWVFSDYDFVLSVGGISPEAIEEILKTIMARQYPTYQSIYLSDGTRVKELITDIDSFKFIDRDGIKYLYSPDQDFKFIYMSNENVIRVSNSAELAAQPGLDVSNNYLSFKSNLISTEGVWKYLQSFNRLEVVADGLMLK